MRHRGSMQASLQLEETALSDTNLILLAEREFPDEREYPTDPIYSADIRLDLGYRASGASSIIRDKNAKI
jgi:hypothetical protein